jgi:hypothetical protein
LGRISSGEEYQVEKNIKLRRISSGENINWGRISIGEEYQVWKNIKWGRISSRENINW